MGDIERANTWVQLGEMIVDVLMDGKLALKEPIPLVPETEETVENQAVEAEPRLVLRISYIEPEGPVENAQ